MSAVLIILRTEKSVLLRHPVGDATGSSAPPTPTGTSTSHTRSDQGRIDYILDTVNTVLATPLDPRRRRRRLRRASAAVGRETR